MGRSVRNKGDIFSFCPLSLWYDGQVGTSGTQNFESSNGHKN